jgi:hypothetical protein
VRQRASKCALENASGCHCLWRGRRGRSQPQRVRQTRPRVRHRLPMCPARRLGFAHSEPVVKSYGRSTARRCVAPEGVRCDLSAASHGSSPRFVRRAADKPWSACAPKTAPPLLSGFHSIRNRFRIRFAFGSVSIRVPRLAQQGHDLAPALLPCFVDGRLAVISKSHIGAPFEKTLGDREVADVCRAMQSCVSVVLKTKGRRRTK